MAAARLLLTTAVAATLTGCSLAPAYAPPATPVATAFREQGPWTPAQPADTQPRGAWWAMFSDPVLDDLEARAEQANPGLAAAVAAYDQARALAAQARAGDRWDRHEPAHAPLGQCASADRRCEPVHHRSGGSLGGL
jgi:hypothetical protein